MGLISIHAARCRRDPERVTAVRFPQSQTCAERGGQPFRIQHGGFSPGGEDPAAAQDQRMRKHGHDFLHVMGHKHECRGLRMAAQALQKLEEKL